MKKQRRPGATETFSVSVDAETKRRLKDLAAEQHRGNVSALITELALRAERRAAFERAWALYGGPEPTVEDVAAIEAEWAAGWKRGDARKPTTKSRSTPPKKTGRRKTAA